MDFNQLTIKSQEAVAAAVEDARRRGNPEVYPEHLLLALLDQELPRSLVPSAQSLRAEAEARLAQKPAVEGAAQQPRISTELSSALDKAGEEAQQLDDEYVSVEHLLLALERRPARRAAGADQGSPRRAARHVPGPRGLVPGAREVRPRPDGARRERQARPGHRPRRGDPPRDPGALAAHEEQPRADRRPGRRQDRHRRGARAAHRRRRRARGAEGQARVGARHRRAARRREVPRRVRGAAEGRARRDRRRRGRADRLHRRAAHDRRRGRRRGRRRRRATC